MRLAIRVNEFCFSTTWSKIGFGLLGLGLLIGLSWWQLERAAQKRQILADFHQQSQRSPVEFLAGEQPMPYQRLVMQGHYESSQFLLDNQFYQHHWGYHVLTPFRLLDGKTVVMVNRGWIAGDVSREQLPNIPAPTEKQTIVGMAYYPLYNRWIKQPLLPDSSTYPIVCEQFLPQLFENFLHQPVAPFMMRLDSSMPYGWHRDWQVVIMSPDRHIAYAVQWGALAIIFCVVFVGVQVKREQRVD